VSTTVRAWLREGFDELEKEKDLPVQFKSQQSKKPILKATDKCIIIRAIINVKDATTIISAIEKLERVP
jgi:hypothetical protein